MSHTHKKMEIELESFVDYMKNIRGLSDKTIYHYLTYHRHFNNRELSQKSINDFVVEKKNNSVCRAYIKCLLEYLNLENKFKVPRAKTGTKKQRLIRDITKIEINKMIDYAYITNKKHGIVFDILYHGALRRDEVNSIRTNSFSWIDYFENPDEYCELSIIGKGDKERKVLVHPRAIKTILDIYLDRKLITLYMTKNDIIKKLNSLSDPLFRKFGEKEVYRVVKKYSRLALEKDLRPHEIRHARATHLEKQGATVRMIQLYLGHSTIRTTEIYLHTDKAKSLEDIKNLDKLIRDN